MDWGGAGKGEERKHKAVTPQADLAFKKTQASPNAVNVLGLHPAWSCDAISEIKSLTRLAMGGLDGI